MRAIFFGSPDFAATCLDALVEVAEVVAVVCQPDKPAGRGMKLRPPAVKVRAEALGLPVWQPRKVRKGDLAERVRQANVDVGVVVAYGRILPRAVLDAPRLGCVNVHASLLPRWRGASPIQHAILAGDAETGITLMQMDEGMDTGPMLSVRRTPIEPDETGGELFVRLAKLGADIVREDLPRVVAGELAPTPQPEGATMAPLLSKSDGAVVWTDTAQQVHDRVRAMSPWPGAYTTFEDGERLKIHRAHVVPGATDQPPGTVLAGEGLRVACGEGVVELDEVQEAGRKRQDAATWLGGRGRERAAAGTRLG